MKEKKKGRKGTDTIQTTKITSMATYFISFLCPFHVDHHWRCFYPDWIYFILCGRSGSRAIVSI